MTFKKEKNVEAFHVFLTSMVLSMIARPLSYGQKVEDDKFKKTPLKTIHNLNTTQGSRLLLQPSLMALCLSHVGGCGMIICGNLH